jgi:hypothetical protein
MSGMAGRAYAIRITTEDGRTWLAYGSGSAPSLFDRFKDASKYRRDLSEHLSKATKMRIVRVEFHIREMCSPWPTRRICGRLPSHNGQLHEQ